MFDFLFLLCFFRVCCFFYVCHCFFFMFFSFSPFCFCLRFFSFSSLGSLHSGRSKVTRVTVARDTKVFEFGKLIFPTLKVAMQLIAFRFHLRRRDCVRPARQPLVSSSALPRDPTSLGISFESAAHCPDRRNLFLRLSLLSKTTAPWSSQCLQISYMWPTVEHFGLLVFCRFLTFHHLEQVLALMIHGFPF